ncbi:hypothetical protein [Streptomyces lydicus]|uniref:hypothetical protein n=1 Tax=Streptomyces lydicus TaxID=47763 RepID=UPI00382AFC2A
MSTRTAASALDQLRDCADTVATYGPEYRAIAHNLLRIAEQQQTAQDTSDHFAFIGGVSDGQHLLGLIALTVQHLADTIPGLPEARLDALHQLVDCCSYLLREAAGTADLDCPHPTDKEH